MKLLIAFIFLTIAFTSCRHNEMNATEYVQYVKDTKHGLHQVKDVGPVLFEVQYEPLPYICLIEHRRNDISSSDLKNLEQQFRGLHYFLFSITSKNQENPLTPVAQDSSLVQDRIDYLSYKASKDFWLIRGGDTLNCVISHLERNYGIAPRLDMVLAFEDKQGEETETQPIEFYYRDQVFGSGLHEFTIKNSDLVSIPTLKTL